MDEEDTAMDLFAGSANFHQTSQTSQESQESEGASVNPEHGLTNLAQAVAWYASVDEEARMGEGPLLNDHVSKGIVV